jgi:protein CMS1
MNRQGGDDLEDDFVPDDLVAFEDDEGYSASPSHLLSEEEELGGQAAERTNKQNSVEQKRKRKKEKEKEKKAKVGRFLLVLGCHVEVGLFLNVED